MPVFQTPQPISATIDIADGGVRVEADDRTETLVEVRPSDPENEMDVKAAEGTRVEHAGGRLLVKAPQRGLFGKNGAVDVTIGLPTGSDIRGSARKAAFRGSGRLGQCRFKTSTGDIQLERTGSLVLSTSFGDVTVQQVAGSAEVATGSGAVRIGSLEGPATIKNSNGDSWVGEAAASLKVYAANGAISVDRVCEAVEAKTANGGIRVGEAVRGSVVLGTAIGQLDIGIRPGTAALLDVRTKSGTVRNLMTAADGPGTSDEEVEVRAVTAVGDVVIRRAGS
ncbi:DUF4097 domain-containing protein [Streptomyces alboflavus]|uniref:DUF4097 family beta strand repeat-containing protein n=1 Tax=Streptomyces alboflavus TaxID=67267 RepID=UPI0036A50BB4